MRFFNNNLISDNRPGFRPSDSTIYRLLSTTPGIYDAFENYDETRAVFLDVSKVFDKVWHEGCFLNLNAMVSLEIFLPIFVIICLLGINVWF